MTTQETRGAVFPRERKVTAVWSAELHKKGRAGSYPANHLVGTGRVDPQYFCREFGEGALLLLMPAPTKGTVSQNVRAQA